MLRSTKSVIAVLAVCLATPLASAQSVSILAEQDSSIYEDATGSVANGIGEFGFTGRNNGGSLRRFFIKFDVASAVPAGATITGVTLEVNVVQLPPNYTSDTYDLHRASTPWGEGPSDGFGQGAPAQAGDATWIHTFYPGTFWAAPGGDFTLAISASADMNSLSRHSFSSNGLIGDVQDFLDNPMANNGWLIKSRVETDRTARGFAAREFSLIPMRPTLIVDYTASPAFLTFCDPANNSTGSPAVLSANFGSGVGSDLHLDVSGGPPPQPSGMGMLGYFLIGNANDAPGIPISDGQFCLVGLGGRFSRYNVAGTDRNSVGQFDSLGNLQNTVGTGGPSGFGFDVPSDVEISGFPLTTIMAGDTYHFQFWYRDSVSGVGRSNFSNGLSVTF
ncbi:MAG: DNRLRE domain-containing protein [bacterium]|nr:DNRLRE domain-containing protein [bacterium]